MKLNASGPVQLGSSRGGGHELDVNVLAELCADHARAYVCECVCV